MTMYRPEFFDIHELVPAHVFRERGERAFELLDAGALRSLDRLREKFGRTTVNNWFWGGGRQWSGLRTPGCGVGVPYSQHYFGRAFDCIFEKVPAEEVREYVLAHPDEFPEITSIELDVSWFHFDTRNCSGIKVFKP